MNRAFTRQLAVIMVAVLICSSLFFVVQGAGKSYNGAKNSNDAVGITQMLQPGSSFSASAIPSSIITNIPYGISNSVTGSASNPYPAQSIGYSQYTPDLWNIANSSVGSVTMSSTQSGGISSTINFSSLGYGSSGQTVIGYPNIEYGYSPWGGGTTAMSNALRLPKQITHFPPTISSIRYKVSGSTPPMDFSYDIWITQSQYATTVSNGDLELMIWTDHASGLVPAGGTAIGTFSTETYVNGSVQNLTWNIYVNNGNKASASQWTIVTFQLQNPLSDASV